MTYDEFDRLILDALWCEAGMLVRDLAPRVPKRALTLTNRQHSAQINHRLVMLQRAGKVYPLDDQKPIAWVKV